MNKLIIFGAIALLLVGFVSSYICIYPATDNYAVQDFKIKINQLAIQEDIDYGLTEGGLRIKLKYFSPCNR